jgi:hypothetical protein
VAEYSAGEDVEAGEEGGEDEFDGWCDALDCYFRLGVFLLLPSYLEFTELLVNAIGIIIFLGVCSGHMLCIK